MVRNIRLLRMPQERDTCSLRGGRVVRFWDNDVLREVEVVVAAIWDFTSRPALSPTPLPPGEGL